MNIDIKGLIDFIGPIEGEPLCAPTDSDWHSLESEYGAAFPADYKAFVSTYGDGLIGSYIRLYNPASSGEFKLSVDVIRRNFAFTDAFFKESEGPRYEYFRDDGPFVVLGATCDGAKVFWDQTWHQTRDQDCLLITDYHRIERIGDVPFSEFIYRWLNQKFTGASLLPCVSQPPFFKRGR